MPKNYAPNTAGGRMTSTIPIVLKDETVADAEKKLLKLARKLETIDYIYVIDKRNVLCGVLSIREMLQAKKDTKIERIMKKELVVVHPLTHQERVVYLALKHGLKAVPVVDKENHLLGIVPYDTILHIFNQEVREDIFRFGGIFHKVGKEFHTINSPAKTMVKARLPSLVIGLLGGIIAASIVSGFESMLSKYIILAAFIPVLVYMSDAVGTQSETLIVRGLALDPKLSLKFYLLREMKVAVSLGLICGILLLLVSLIGWQNISTSIVIGISLFISVLASAFSATLLPVFLKKINLDPAAASGPFATIISDVSTLIIYFLIASLLLGYLA